MTVCRICALYVTRPESRHFCSRYVVCGSVSILQIYSIEIKLITANYTKRHLLTFHLGASGQHAGPASRPVGPKAEVRRHRRISHHCTVIYRAIQGKRFFGLFELTQGKKPSCCTSYKRLASFVGARPSRWHTRASFARFRSSSCLINKAA